MLGATAQGIIVFIVICTILILLLITFITVILYRYQQKQNAYFKNIEDLKIKYEKDRLQSILEIQEQTFQNISREIHDNIGQILSLVRINMNVLSEKFGEDNFDTTDELLGKAIRDLRNLSHNLNSNRLKEIGIVEGLRSLIIQLDKTEKYTTEFISPENALSFMNNDHCLILYRMVQEVIHNILKHANATHIVLEIKPKGNISYFVTITDNGKGFDMKALQGQNTGIGLQNIFSRAKLINATVKVNSKEGEGTSIIFEITNQKSIK